MSAEKDAARKAAFVRRKAAHERHRDAAALALRDHLAGCAGRIIAAYLPIRTEADPLPAMEALAASNRICVPVIEGAGQPLSFREWRPGCALVPGPFKVSIPATGATVVPDLVIAPMLAFDDALFRLGYGGGFYDRTLEQLRSTGPVEALGFAYSAQYTEILPREATDQPLDRLITEAGLRQR